MVVTEDVTEETFKVAGEITVVNPAPMEMTVDLFDELGGGTDAVIGACTNGTYAGGKLTIPANTNATCAYTAEPDGRTDTVNNVTATLNGIDFDAFQGLHMDNQRHPRLCLAPSDASDPTSFCARLAPLWPTKRPRT